MNWKISKFGTLKLKKPFSIELSPDTLVVHKEDDIICVLSSEKDLKDAALIAAAPELIGAIEFIINGNSMLSYETFSKLKFAVDKANAVDVSV